jgi:hypothetical protein
MVRLLLSVLLGIPFVAAIPAPVALPTPPGIPSAATAESELAALTVAAQGSEDGYSRSLFPHWISQGGYVCPHPSSSLQAKLTAQHLQHP